MGKKYPLQEMLDHQVPTQLKSSIAELIVDPGATAAARHLVAAGPEAIKPAVAAFALSPNDRRGTAVAIANAIGEPAIDPLIRMLETPGWAHVPMYRASFERCGYQGRDLDDAVRLSHKAVCEMALACLTAVVSTAQLDSHWQYELAVTAAHYQDHSYDEMGPPIFQRVPDAGIVDAARGLARSLSEPNRANYTDAFERWPLWPYEPEYGREWLEMRRLEAERRRAEEERRRREMPPPVPIDWLK